MGPRPCIMLALMMPLTGVATACTEPDPTDAVPAVIDVGWAYPRNIASGGPIVTGASYDLTFTNISSSSSVSGRLYDSLGEPVGNPRPSYDDGEHVGKLNITFPAVGVVTSGVWRMEYDGQVTKFRVQGCCLPDPPECLHPELTVRSTPHARPTSPVEQRLVHVEVSNEGDAVATEIALYVFLEAESAGKPTFRTHGPFHVPDLMPNETWAGDVGWDPRGVIGDVHVRIAAVSPRTVAIDQFDDHVTIAGYGGVILTAPAFVQGPKPEWRTSPYDSVVPIFPIEARGRFV